MGKATGFLEYKRTVPENRPVKERIGDWNEFHTHLADEKQRIQGARCMDCGIPYCHTGTLVKGAAVGCPLNNLIPEWNELIYRDMWKEAYKRLEKTNNFPEFTGRVCPAPCEGSCTEGINDPPVAIKCNECHIADKAWEEGFIIPNPPVKRTGRKVAVVGSGPAGLACANQLNKAGHKVTVFEREDRIGGLLMYGIPNMKLDKKIVMRRIKLMEDEGVIFKTNANAGVNISASDLKSEFDAVVICTGATNPRNLNVSGREFKGIHFAMEFLRENTRAILDSEIETGIMDFNKSRIIATGKDVVIIGGGDTGTDCVGTSIRQGCKSVVQLEIMPKPLDERQSSNPWPEWPSVIKTDYGQEEAMEIFGNDPRKWLTTVESFEQDGKGNVAYVNTVSVKWEKDDSGRFAPVQVDGTQKRIPAQLVLLAMGFLGPENYLPDEMNLEKDARSNIKAAENNYMTNEPGIFAAGDARRGQSLVVWAIDEGRKAARECDRYLTGQTFLP